MKCVQPTVIKVELVELCALDEVSFRFGLEARHVRVDVFAVQKTRQHQVANTCMYHIIHTC